MTHILNLTKRMHVHKTNWDIFKNYVKVVESVLRTVQFWEKQPFYTLFGNKGFQEN